MNTRKLFAGLISFTIIAISGVVIAATVPATKKVIKIDQVPGKKGAVTFDHAKHSATAKNAKGAAITCKDCHHTLAAAEPANVADVKACGACHVKEGEAQKEHAGKKARFMAVKKGSSVDVKTMIWHASCQECHKAVAKADASKKSIKTCKACHK